MFAPPKHFYTSYVPSLSQKNKYFFQNTLNEDHQHVETWSKVPVEGVCQKCLNLSKREYVEGS